VIKSYLKESYLVSNASLLFITVTISAKILIVNVLQFPSLAMISTVDPLYEPVYMIESFFYYIQVEEEKRKRNILQF